ncbi:hypothetical protein Tco_0324948 [Tanacetum coccineum]
MAKTSLSSIEFSFSTSTKTCLVMWAKMVEAIFLTASAFLFSLRDTCSIKNFLKPLMNVFGFYSLIVGRLEFESEGGPRIWDCFLNLFLTSGSTFFNIRSFQRLKLALDWPRYGCPWPCVGDEGKIIRSSLGLGIAVSIGDILAAGILDKNLLRALPAYSLRLFVLLFKVIRDFIFIHAFAFSACFNSL